MSELSRDDVWTVKAALDWTVGYLERKGDENPRLSSEWLLSEACRMRRIELYVNFDRPLSMDERDVLRDYVARRGKGEPLQYITGEAAFRHIAVKVRPGVLIPRPETEVLVSEALALLPAAPKRAARDAFAEAGAALSDAELFRAVFEDAPVAAAGDEGAGASGDGSIDLSAMASASDDRNNDAEPEMLLAADVCTGTGCIACSLAYERPDVRVVATDISAEAVSLARENASDLALGDRIDVIECDLGSGVDPALGGKFDLVVSNPPYVPTAVMSGIPAEVADFEPALALDGGLDGLDVFRRLLPFAAWALKSGGGLAVELHETCLDTAASLAQQAGFAEVRIADDLAGRPRVLTCRRV